MREGKLAVEAEPLALIRTFETATLSEAFLKVCQCDGNQSPSSAAALRRVMPDDTLTKEEDAQSTVSSAKLSCFNRELYGPFQMKRSIFSCLILFCHQMALPQKLLKETVSVRYAC
jgi:hypothetical protein